MADESVHKKIQLELQSANNKYLFNDLAFCRMSPLMK